jgi:putative polyketide hydroxylase
MFDVAIIGAGPGGLAAAATLGSYGVSTLLVDQRQSPSTLPRATVASTGTMELLRRFGLEQRAWERSIDVEWQAWECETLAAAAHGSAVEVGLPTRSQAALVSPSRPALLPQDELEPLLEEHVRSLSSVRVERGVEVKSLDELHARYLIGADGARSMVRTELGIAIDDPGPLAQRLGVLFRAPLWELAGEHRYGIYFLGNDLSFIPAGKPDRWILGIPWDGPADRAQMIRWIREAAGVPDLPIELERAMPVSFGVGLAERFRQGNVFLIGDAAHRVTPRGGTGLNTAIRDGFDIGWKLAWVLRGWAGEELLDSYERERRPVAEFNTERSSRPDGSLLATAFGLAADIGGRIPHVWAPRGERLVSTLDLLGDGLTLFTGPHYKSALPPAVDLSAPVRTEGLDHISARALGLTPDGSLLARPDGAAVSVATAGRA